MRMVVWIVLTVSLAVAATIWLADRPGTVTIDWQGYLVDVPVAAAAVAVALLMMVAVIVFSLVRWLVKLPHALAEARRNRRRSRGYKALTTGMVAVAAGDGHTAELSARRADQLLNEPPLTMLLSAQAAQLNGDETAARRYFEAMLENDETRFLGLRGLLTQSLKRHDDIEALDYIEAAKALQPETPWLAATAFETETRLRRWEAALISLARAVRLRAIDKEDGSRHRAALLLERSRVAEAEDRLDESRTLAHKAAALRPGFAPAIRREAMLFAREGKAAKARSLIETAWRSHPHRLLAETYIGLGPETESKAERLARTERLLKVREDDAEGLLIAGEAALAADDFEKARMYLIRAAQVNPAKRVHRLLARLEIAEKDDGQAAGQWLTRSEAAHADPMWICSGCGTPAGNWSILCRACEGVDTLEWRSGERQTTLPPAAAHLALAPVGSTLPAMAEVETSPTVEIKADAAA